MPPTNAKNVSASVFDLGLGDVLQQEVEDATDETKKKKKLLDATPSPFGQSQAVNVLGLNMNS